MAGLDDAGMDRADRESGAGPRLRPAGTRTAAVSSLASVLPSGCAHAPAAMIEPGPRVGRADRLKPEEIVDRALSRIAGGWRAADGRKVSVRAGIAEHDDLAGVVSSSSAIWTCAGSPHRPSSVHAAVGELPRSPAASPRRRRSARGQGRCASCRLAVRESVEQGHGAHPSSLATC